VTIRSRLPEKSIIRSARVSHMETNVSIIHTLGFGYRQPRTTS
jgi:hypothetical protein